jgi:hypothetical protein
MRSETRTVIFLGIAKPSGEKITLKDCPLARSGLSIFSFSLGEFQVTEYDYLSLCFFQNDRQA